MMQNEPREPRRIEQNNQDSSTGFQAEIEGGNNYFGREIHIYNAPSSPPVAEVLSEPPHNIPPSNAVQFVGRDRELTQLHSLLQQGNTVAIVDATGTGGVGKTELAIQYCLKHLPEYPGGICWLYPKTSDTGTQIVEFARVQFLRVQVPDGVSLSNQVLFCWRNWCSGATLLVIDNVLATEYEQIKSYMPSNTSRFKVLLTTRDRLRVPLQLPINGLEKESAMELMKVLMGDALVQQEANVAERLCALVGYSPLALHVISGYVKPEVVSC